MSCSGRIRCSEITHKRFNTLLKAVSECFVERGRKTYFAVQLIQEILWAAWSYNVRQRARWRFEPGLPFLRTNCVFAVPDLSICNDMLQCNKYYEVEFVVYRGFLGQVWIRALHGEIRSRILSYLFSSGKLCRQYLLGCV